MNWGKEVIVVIRSVAVSEQRLWMAKHTQLIMRRWKTQVISLFYLFHCRGRWRENFASLRPFASWRMQRKYIWEPSRGATVAYQSLYRPCVCGVHAWNKQKSRIVSSTSSCGSDNATFKWESVRWLPSLLVENRIVFVSTVWIYLPVPLWK